MLKSFNQLYCKHSNVSLFYNIGKYVRLFSERNINLYEDELELQRKLKPEVFDDQRFVKLAIIGTPNSGKSTLANQLLGLRYSSVSSKVHTTRKTCTGIYTHGHTQLILLDTPGLISEAKRRKHNLEFSLLNDPHSVLKEADIIAVIVDISNVWNRTGIDQEILYALHNHEHKHCILVLNKIDNLKKKKELLQVTRILTDGVIAGETIVQPIKKPPNINDYITNTSKVNESDLKAQINELVDKEDILDIDFADEKYKDVNISQLKRMKKMNISSEVLHKGWPHFDAVFMTSALNGDGVTDLKNYIFDQSKQSPWQYHSSLVTDCSPVQIAIDCIQEKLLDELKDDIPYCIDVKLSFWEVDDNGLLRATFDLNCESKRHMFAAIGLQGETIKRISQLAKQELMNSFRREIQLHLSVNYNPGHNAVKKSQTFNHLNKYYVNQEY